MSATRRSVMAAAPPMALATGAAGAAVKPLKILILGGVGDGVGSRPKLTRDPADWLAAQKVSGWSDLPVWLPGTGSTEGFHRRSNKAAMAAGLTFRPLKTTAADALAWWNALPAERRAKPKAGLTPEREAQLSAQWKAKA